MRSPFAPVALALVALISALARWGLQGSRNFYTAVSRKCWVPDPDVGWSISGQHPVWLGLEVIAIVAAITVGLAVGGWIIRRRERTAGKRAKVLRAAAWALAAVPLVVPIAAFASGFGADDCHDVRPPSQVAKIDIATGADKAGGGGSGSGSGSNAAPAPPPLAGSIDLPAGSYAVVVHELSEITAQLEAGGEQFNARFPADKGEWSGDPKDVTKPMSAEVGADAASVDTGIDERSKHAREGYLHADKFPRLGWKLDKLLAARQDGPDRVVFKAAGTISLMGKTHPVEVTGALKKADAAALGRLKLPAGTAALIAEADFSLVIKETALAPDAGTFTGDRFPIHVSLVLRHTVGKSR